MTILKNLCAAVVAAAGITFTAPVVAQDSSVVLATHGDWEVRCASEDKSLCAMTQSASDSEGRPLVNMKLLRLTGQKLKDGTNIPAQMEILVPLGVVLTNGMSVKVDSKQNRIAPYRFCVQSGCRVLEPLTDAYIAELKTGSAAQITFRSVDGKTHQAAISLKGFTKAYDALPPAK